MFSNALVWEASLSGNDKSFVPHTWSKSGMVACRMGFSASTKLSAKLGLQTQVAAYHLVTA